MMTIAADAVSKRYDLRWIVKDWSYTFEAATITGISGRNGSGKSTLIKMLSGYLPPSKGTIRYALQEKTIPAEQLYRYTSLVAPYTDLVLEYTMKEMFQFHTGVRKMRAGITYEDFKDIVQLPQAHQQIQYYSSGMNQRLQLALQIMSDTPLLLLDEPTSYLDKEARQWTYDLLSKHSEGRTIIISSNDDADFDLVADVVSVS